MLTNAKGYWEGTVALYKELVMSLTEENRQLKEEIARLREQIERAEAKEFREMERGSW